MSNVFFFVEKLGACFETSILTDVLPLISWMPLIIFMFGSLPFLVLSSVMKYAIYSLIIGPLILIGTTPLCCGGILSVNLTVTIVAFCSYFLYMLKIFLLFEYNSFFSLSKA